MSDSVVCCVTCGRWWRTVHDVPLGAPMPYKCDGYLGHGAHAFAPAYCVDIVGDVGFKYLKAQASRYHALAKLFHAAANSRE